VNDKTDKEVDNERRQFLTTAATVVGGAGMAMAAVPFAASLQPSARVEAVGAPVEIDFSHLEPDKLLMAKWRGKPVWVLRRTREELATLKDRVPELRDPQSAEPQQPDYTKNEHRSIKPEYLIVIGICTHLGCSPKYVPEAAAASYDLGPEWQGGFFCPCHGSRFDLAGRVYKGVPAPTNLVVPPHKYLSDTRILVGEDEGASA
jgi:ubiquinol-cytochrome c reductase iron-sulfur subunit